MKDITLLDPVALRTLAVAVRLGTFEAAARDLHVTPSAVSQRIKALETRIGRVLLHRVKPLEPTEAGLVLVRLATQTELSSARRSPGSSRTRRTRGTSYTSLPIAVNAEPSTAGSSTPSPRCRPGTASSSRSSARTTPAG